MRREKLYLTDIITAIDAIEGFLQNVSSASFLKDDLIRSAVLQKLTIIGEAAARLPSELRSCYAHIPWTDIIGFRNIAVHAYFSVDWSIVWTTATQEAPALRAQISSILSAEEEQTGLNSSDCTQADRMQESDRDKDVDQLS